MKINTSSFLKSFTHAKDVPDNLPAFVTIGRSNVGKSSFINSLLKRKNLARISSMPGKTQLINYFLVNDAWYLVDLPGYGWAKVSKSSRLQWEKMIKTYLSQIKINTLFLLLDSRHPLQNIDLTFIQWVIQAKLTYALVLTKADKCKPIEIKNHIQQLEDTLHERGWSLPPLFVSSIKEKRSNSSYPSTSPNHLEILTYIEECITSLSSLE